MRLTQKKIDELSPILREWLDENGPAFKCDIARGLGWSDDLVTRLIRTKPSWLVSPGFVTKGHAQLVHYHSQGEHKMGSCEKCGVNNFHFACRKRNLCGDCSFSQREPILAGYTDEQLEHINPDEPCEYAPGTEEKVMVLAKRYADGVPELWNSLDAGFEAANSSVTFEELDWDDE